MTKRLQIADLGEIANVPLQVGLHVTRIPEAAIDLRARSRLRIAAAKKPVGKIGGQASARVENAVEEVSKTRRGLEAAITPRTRMIVLSSPHNPTGKVFTREELETIARVAIEHDLIVLTDEVYEYLTFDDAEHVPLATLPGMRERILSLSSTGKTFSLTGWKIGWATGPRPLVAAAQAAHQFLTFAVATPFQAAMAHALDTFRDDFFTTYRREYTNRRDFLVGALRDAGFVVAVPRGTDFVLADFTATFDGDDRAFAWHLIETCGVAAIPPSVFFAAQPEVGKRLIRFALCKRMETLERAAERLRRL